MTALDYLGLIPVGLADYPGRVAATLFTAGCSLACPYCHNPELTKSIHPEDFLPRDAVMQFLTQRQGLLSGVVITGGEPTLHPGLGELIDDIASMGYKVKLDTAGVHPRALERCLSRHQVSFVALDFKTSPEKYDLVGGQTGTGHRVLQSLELLRRWKQQSSGEYEVRTVCAPGIVDRNTLTKIRDLLQPDEHWRLIRFRPGRCLDPAIEQRPPVSESLIREIKSDSRKTP